MRQQVGLIFSKNAVKRALKLYLFMLLTLLCFNRESLQADSTFFPENIPEAVTEDTSERSSDAIKEWAELKTSTKLDQVSQKERLKELTPNETQAPALTNNEGAHPASEPRLAVIPNAQVSFSSQEPKSLESKAQTSTPYVSSTPQTQKPLESTTVKPHPKALPIPEKNQASSPLKDQSRSQSAVLSYSDVAGNRPPLGILEPTQEAHSQRWYIYSSAIRGLKNSSDSLHIVSMEGAAPNRGEEIKNLLVEMGIEPEKIQLIRAKGEQNQVGIIYIFAGK